MFENYIHTKEDLEAIEEALEYLERPELDFIFKDRKLVDNTLVISYDSKELFIWTKLKHSKLKKMPCRVEGYNAYRIPHKIKIKDEDQRGWCAEFYLREIPKYLPTSFHKSWHGVPRISGSLLTPFTRIHKELRKTKKWLTDPYYTKESYLATIIHEFGHVYYRRGKPKHSPEKERLTRYLRAALQCYQDKKPTLPKNTYPRSTGLGFASEVFAFCTDYSAATIFWSNHKRGIDKNNRSRIKKAIKEKEINFVYESHNYAAVIGRLILEKYPKDWPSRVLSLAKG